MDTDAKILNAKESFRRRIDALPKNLRCRVHNYVRSHVSRVTRRISVGELSVNGIALIKSLRNKRLQDKRVPFRAIEAAFGLKLRNGNNAFIAAKR